MAKILNEQDLIDIMYGAAFLGAGGGGGIKSGLKIIEAIKSVKGVVEVKLIEPEEMLDNEYAATVAGLGAPKAFDTFDFGTEFVGAFSGMQKASFMAGKKVKYVMAGELGALNTLVGIYVAAMADVPIVNCDGNGRAVPELNTSLAPIYNIPTSPLVLAGGNGDTILVYLDNPLDSKAAENIARYSCMAYNMLVGFCTWAVDKYDIKNKLAPKTITKCLDLGRAIRCAKKEKLNPLTEIKKVLMCKEYFRGKIEKIDLKTEGGFDFGRTTIKGIGIYSEKNYTIDFQNENMLLKDEKGNLLLTAPELISLFDINTMKPLTNADTEEGMEIMVIGSPASENWWAIPEGYTCFKDILSKLDYNGSPVRYSM